MPGLRHRASRLGVLAATGATLLLSASTVLASSPGADVRLSNDFPGGGYVSADDLAGLPHYTDATLDECSRARGRQNEPALAIDPRDSRVMIGSANDYCGVFNDGVDADGAPIAVRSDLARLLPLRERRARASSSSLVPGYPGDTSTLGRSGPHPNRERRRPGGGVGRRGTRVHGLRIERRPGRHEEDVR